MADAIWIEWEQEEQHKEKTATLRASDKWKTKKKQNKKRA